MKTTLFTILTVSLFAIVSASSFTDGIATGYMSKNVERKLSTKKKKVSTIKYYNFTRDTSLQKFPPVEYPECVVEKIKIVPKPLTLGEKFVAIIFIALVIMSIVNLMCFADDETREWFIGYMIGRILEGMINDDD